MSYISWPVGVVKRVENVRMVYVWRERNSLSHLLIFGSEGGSGNLSSFHWESYFY